MAGIGFKLEGLLERGTLAHSAGAYLTGAAIAGGPWLLTAALFASLRLSGGGLGANELIALVTSATVVLAAPLQAILSRYAADRLWERRPEAVAAPLRRAIAGALVAGAAAGAALAALDGRPALWWPAAAVGAGAAAEWLLLSVGGGLASPLAVLRAFALGVLAGAAGAAILERAGFGEAGRMVGLAAGEGLGAALLLRLALRPLPAAEDEAARLAPAFREHPAIAAGALAYQAAVWGDALVVLALESPAAARHLAGARAIAWAVSMPAYAWIVVRMETRFYRRFRAFYDGIESGEPLKELDVRAGALEGEAHHLLASAAGIELATASVALLAAPWLATFSGLGAADAGLVRLAILGAGLQSTAFLGMLLLLYLDLQREALRVALALFCANALLAGGLALAGGDVALAYPIAGATGALVAVVYVLRRFGSLVADTFQGQPWASRL